MSGHPVYNFYIDIGAIKASDMVAIWVAQGYKM
jgi:hypothetical protein